MMPTLDKAELLKQWFKLKKAEDTAKDKRHEIEKEIELLYGKFDENSKTFKEDDLGFKVNIKHNETIKLDQEKWKTVRQDIPADLRPEKIKFDLDKTGFEFLKKDHNEVYMMVSNCVEIKPAKSTIKIEKL